MVRLLLYTDQPVLALGLHGTVQPAGIEVTAICNSLADVVTVLAAGPVDVLLLDHTSEITYDALSSLQRAAGGAKVILLIDRIETLFAFQAMELGVRGILRKTLPRELLVKCVRKVLDGELWFEKALVLEFLQRRMIRLTPREGQVVTLVARGMRNKEMADALDITAGTVKIYLSRLYLKLGVRGRYELAIYGMKNLGHLEGTGARDQQSLRSIALTPAA